MSWATDDGWEDSSWGVIATEASLDHSRTIVDNQRGDIFIVAHGGVWLIESWIKEGKIAASASMRSWPEWLAQAKDKPISIQATHDSEKV